MDKATLHVQDNMVVSLAYSLTTAARRAGRRPKRMSVRRVVQGRRQLVPGLEQALYGMAVGDEKDVVVEAGNGYGEIDPKAVKTLSSRSLASLAQAAPGQRIRLRHKQSGEIQRATVVDVQPDKVVVDFNHPLAGKTLHYRVRVEDLRPATPEEVASGKVDTSPGEAESDEESES